MTLLPTPELLETVAVALFMRKNGPKAKWDTFPKGYKQGYLELADAAIAAINSANGESLKSQAE